MAEGVNPLSLPFVHVAIAASLLAGNALALLGGFVLLRRVSFSGLAVSQLAALGAVLGAIIGAHDAAGFVVSLLCVILGQGALGLLARDRRLPEEAWVACLYAAGAAAAVLLLSKDPHGETHTMSLFFGNVLALGPADLLEAGLLLAATLAILGPWLHRWLWLFVDPLSAEVSGLNSGLWQFVFSALFGVAMTLGIHLFGALLAFSFLILPAMAALLLSSRLGVVLVLIPLVNSAAILCGTVASVPWDFPTGPFVAAVLAAVVLAAALTRLKSH